MTQLPPAPKDGKPPEADTARGALAALAAYLAWGAIPIYVKALEAVPPLEIVAHRIVWSLALVGLLAILLRLGGRVGRTFADRRLLLALAASTAVLTFNWGLYVWAVVNGHLVEASLGYFINPLVIVLLGVLVLEERLRPRQWAAVAMAALGVAILVAWEGRLPWIALLLAMSFGLYALIRKLAPVDAVTGFLVEVALAAPFAFAFLLALGFSGAGAFGRGGLGTNLLIALSGVVTATPIILYVQGAKGLRLSTLGLLQYLAPTGQLLLGVFVYGEPFTPPRQVAFALIWSALAVYTFGSLGPRRRT